MHIAGTTLLTGYHSITQLQIETASTARNYPCAIQKARAMYSCLKSSISDELKATLFSQAENFPDHEDGTRLFAQLITFTMAVSLQLSMDSFKRILEFNPTNLYLQHSIRQH